MHRTIPLLISGAAAVIPVSAAFFGASPSHAAARTTAVAHAVQGPSTSMRWGPVQVTIIVQGKRIMDIKVTSPLERPRSAIINNRAIPLLRKEALQAQVANVQFVSGATMTSKAFETSLQAALKKAHL